MPNELLDRARLEQLPAKRDRIDMTEDALAKMVRVVSRDVRRVKSLGEDIVPNHHDSQSIQMIIKLRRQLKALEDTVPEGDFRSLMALEKQKTEVIKSIANIESRIMQDGKSVLQESAKVTMEAARLREAMRQHDDKMKAQGHNLSEAELMVIADEE